MKTVLRNNPDGSISHVYYMTENGTHIYLTKADFDRMLDLSDDIVNSYYDLEKKPVSSEYILEDLRQLLTGEVSLKTIRYRIAKCSGVIKDKVFEING